MGPGDVLLALIIVGLPTMMLMLIANRFFSFGRSSSRSRR